MDYHGLGRRQLLPRGFLVRPQVNGGTLGGRMAEPSFETTGWQLETLEERRRAHPSFQAPSLLERHAVSPSMRVKLLFLLLTREHDQEVVQCERLWVTVTQKVGRRLIGILESKPVTPTALSPGETIEFGPEHIAAILIPAKSSAT